MSPATIPGCKAYDKHFARCLLRLLGMTSVITSTTLVPAANAITFETKFDFPNFPKNTHALPRATGNGAGFDWQKLTPSSRLNWVACFDSRECARLEVPLDYSSPNGEKAAVALLRLKSKVSHDSKEYRGPVLFNPGGPGVSGVGFIISLGATYQQILGDGFDIVGFDPRGIGETTPPVSVFPEEIERAYWNAGSPPLLNSTADALPRSFSRALLFNELVEARSKRAAEHATTAVVARDMLSITKAHGRDRLQYWGFSYGTVLGATYAAMFPVNFFFHSKNPSPIHYLSGCAVENNIERMIIDGVGDFDDYYSGSWTRNLFDTDKVLQFLYDKCASAGPACPLHANSSAMVQQRVERLLASVKANPVPVINGTDYALIDFTILKQALLQSLYSPFSFFPLAAGAMAALEDGDGRPALTLLRTSQPLPKCNAPPQLMSTRQEAQLAVVCSDAASVVNSTSEIQQDFEELSKFSIFADIWTDTTRTSCAGWKVRPAERFSGPFAVNTSFPLLVIGNTADPVTPLVGAQKAARTFRGSVLLKINTPGHTSQAAASICGNKVIRDYFTEGKLPKAGMMCEIEDVLFGSNSMTPQNLTSGDAELLAATRLPI